MAMSKPMMTMRAAYSQNMTAIWRYAIGPERLSARWLTVLRRTGWRRVPSLLWTRQGPRGPQQQGFEYLGAAAARPVLGPWTPALSGRPVGSCRGDASFLLGKAWPSIAP